MKTTSADTWFSRFIRLRDAQESNGVLFVSCFTCDKVKQPKHMQNSHFEPRQHKATRYNEVNCQVGCPYCNKFLEGNKVIFSERLEKKYGEGTVAKLKLMAKTSTKINDNSISDYYKDLVNNLLKEKGWTKLKWW